MKNKKITLLVLSILLLMVLEINGLWFDTGYLRKVGLNLTVASVNDLNSTVWAVNNGSVNTQGQCRFNDCRDFVFVNGSENFLLSREFGNLTSSVYGANTTSSVVYVCADIIGKTGSNQVFGYYNYSTTGGIDNNLALCNDSYVAVYHFDEGGGNSVFNSLTGVNNLSNVNILFGNNVARFNTTAVYGQALSFNGNSSGNHPSTTVTNSLSVNYTTVEAWAKPDGNGTASNLALVSWNDQTGGGWVVYHNQGKWGCTVDGDDGTSRDFQTPDIVKVNQWQYVSCVWNSSGGWLYVNGVLQGNFVVGNKVIKSNKNTLQVGCSASCSADTRFSGLIDEVRVSSRGRSLGYIQSQYNSSLNFSGGIINRALPSIPSGFGVNRTFYNITNNVVVSWSNSNNSDVYVVLNYSVEVYNQSDFSYLILLNESINESQLGGINRTNVTLSNLSGNSCVNGCYWRVKAVESNGNTQQNSSFSNLQGFIIDDRPPNRLEYQGFTLNNNSYSKFSWVYVNISVVERCVSNVTFNVYNSTGLVNSTVTLTSNNDVEINFSNTLPNFVYDFNFSVYDNATNLNFSETRRITLDNTLPFVNLTEPSNVEQERSNIRINYTVTDNFNINLCWFNVSTSLGDLVRPVGGNLSINYLDCSITNSTFSMESDGSYVFYLSANDSAGNLNITNASFSITATSDEPKGGQVSSAGGGNVLKTVRVGCQQEFFGFEPESIAVVTVSGGKREESFFIKNLGREDTRVYLSVEAYNTTEPRNWVSVNTEQLILEPNKRKEEKVPVFINVPLGTPKGRYFFGVRVRGGTSGCELLSVPMPVEIRVSGFLGVVSDLTEKLLRPTNIFIFSFLWIIFGIGLFMLLGLILKNVINDFEKKKFWQGIRFTVVFISSFSVSVIIISFFGI